MEGPYMIFWIVSFISFLIALPVAVVCMGVSSRGSLPAIASTSIVVSALLGLWVPYLSYWGMLTIVLSTLSLIVWLGVSLLPMPIPPVAKDNNTVFTSYSDEVKSLPAYVRLFMLGVYVCATWLGYAELVFQHVPQVWPLYAAHLLVSLYLCASAINFLLKQLLR
jgi:hypothetical protein